MNVILDEEVKLLRQIRDLPVVIRELNEDSLDAPYIRLTLDETIGASGSIKILGLTGSNSHVLYSVIGFNHVHMLRQILFPADRTGEISDGERTMIYVAIGIGTPEILDLIVSKYPLTLRIAEELWFSAYTSRNVITARWLLVRLLTERICLMTTVMFGVTDPRRFLKDVLEGRKLICNCGCRREYIP